MKQFKIKLKITILLHSVNRLAVVNGIPFGLKEIKEGSKTISINTYVT